MGHEKRILEAFTSNGIGRILFIDDVYDPPTLDETWSGDLVEHIESEIGRAAILEQGVEEASLGSAIDAISRGDLDDRTVKHVVSALYRAFTSSRDAKYDPGERFKTLKGAGLDAVTPTVELVRKCGETVQVSLAGLENAEAIFREQQPDVLFLDYFLGPEVPVSGTVNKGTLTAARQESVELLKRILEAGGNPAVVLMSSRERQAKPEEYRREAGADKVLAVRFRFLSKGWIKRGRKSSLTISHEAADTLLDTTQGFRFGGVLQDALKVWRKGAEDALQALMNEVAGLEPKDFAYLLRFRLHEEGEAMGHYLEWLFGESLRALVDESVDWDQGAIQQLDEVELSKGIEGAFDGPSLRIAKMFHRIRVNEYRRRKQTRDELGDLYATKDNAIVRAVVTPDCDLVPRKGKLKVDSVLTMGGAIRSFDQESTSADHFLLRGNKAFSVKWNPKDLRSFPIAGTGAIDEDDGFEYVGTLRPLYAQEMQRIALADLARLGLAVSPAMGVDATVRAYLRVRAGGATEFRELPIQDGAIATIMLGRGDGEKGHAVLLRRRYLHDVADELRKVDSRDLTEEDVKRRDTFLLESKEAERARGFLSKGAPTVETGPLGTRFSIAVQPENKTSSAWLQFLLTLNNEAMEELVAADPFFVAEAAPAEGAPVPNDQVR